MSTLRTAQTSTTGPPAVSGRTTPTMADPAALDRDVHPTRDAHISGMVHVRFDRPLPFGPQHAASSSEPKARGDAEPVDAGVARRGQPPRRHGLSRTRELCEGLDCPSLRAVRLVTDPGDQDEAPLGLMLVGQALAPGWHELIALLRWTPPVEEVLR